MTAEIYSAEYRYKYRDSAAATDLYIAAQLAAAAMMDHEALFDHYDYLNDRELGGRWIGLTDCEVMDLISSMIVEYQPDFPAGSDF